MDAVSFVRLLSFFLEMTSVDAGEKKRFFFARSFSKSHYEAGSASRGPGAVQRPFFRRGRKAVFCPFFLLRRSDPQEQDGDFGDDSRGRRSRENLDAPRGEEVRHADAFFLSSCDRISLRRRQPSLEAWKRACWTPSSSLTRPEAAATSRMKFSLVVPSSQSVPS